MFSFALLCHQSESCRRLYCSWSFWISSREPRLAIVPLSFSTHLRTCKLCKNSPLSYTLYNSQGILLECRTTCWSSILHCIASLTRQERWLTPFLPVTLSSANTITPQRHRYPEMEDTCTLTQCSCRLDMGVSRKSHLWPSPPAFTHSFCTSRSILSLPLYSIFVLDLADYLSQNRNLHTCARLRRTMEHDWLRLGELQRLLEHHQEYENKIYELIENFPHAQETLNDLKYNNEDLERKTQHLFSIVQTRVLFGHQPAVYGPNFLYSDERFCEEQGLKNGMRPFNIDVRAILHSC
jgi:hypothetical protein